MKKKLILLAALLLGAGLQNASATFIVNVDENGNGSFNKFPDGEVFQVPGVMMADPSGGVAGNVLVYTLPFVIFVPQMGDLVLTEPGQSTPSDVIRFWGTPTAGLLLFYSDNADGADALADTGLPNTLLPLVVTLPEIGPEGNNGATYVPSDPTQIGWGDDGVTYNITSDAPVPEPTTMIAGALLLLPFGVSTFRILRKNCSA